MDCSFCRILYGSPAANFIYHDDRCAAVMDLRPVNPGQLLVVPLRHAAYLADISDDEAHLMRVAHRMAAALSASALRSEGVNFFLADGEAAMQEVFHVHLHMIPRFRGDGFGSPSGPTTSPARGTSSIVPQANPGALSQQIPEMRRADRA